MDTGLFNILTRQQVYVEGVKNWFAIDLNRFLKLLRDFISKELRRLGVSSLGDLSKSGASAFMRKIDKRANEILSDYGTEFLAELRRFCRVSLAGQRSAFALALPKVDTTGLSMSSIWSATKDRIVPAFGSTVKDAAITLVSTARDKIRQRLNTGYADNEAIQETEAAVANLDPGGDPSTLKSIAATARSFVSTALQHAVATVSDFVGAIVHDCYQWCSVIDSKTSPICRERNGQVYRYGSGPVPPAHPHCRSHTVPVSCGDKGDVPTFYNWLTKQPADFLSDAFGASFARKVADGSVTAKDVPDAIAYPALSLEDYELKAKFLAA